VKSRSGQWAVTIVAFLLGLLLVVQLRSQGRPDLSLAASMADQALIMSSLVDSNATLRREVATLEKELAGYQQRAARENLQALVNDLNRLKIVNGLVQVSGPGIVVYITGSLKPLDLQDLINEVRNAGAEAIGLNGLRVVMRSVVAGEGAMPVLDAQPLQQPYILEAIGDPEGLHKAMTRPGGLLMIFQQSYADVRVNVIKVDEITLPIYRGKYEVRYARPVR